jgi:hypothetical protein
MSGLEYSLSIMLSVLRESIDEFRSRASNYIRQNGPNYAHTIIRELIIEGCSILRKLIQIAITAATFQGLSMSAQIDMQHTFGHLYGGGLQVRIDELKEITA